MERNQIVGFLLMLATLFLWAYFNKPDAAELERRQVMQDSIARVEASALNSLSKEDKLPIETPEVKAILPDSVLLLQNAGLFGPFAPSSVGEEKTYVVENSKVKLTFSNKGGKIVSAELKEHTKEIRERGKEVVVEPVILLNDARNKFEYLLPVATAPSGSVSTEDLYFETEVKGNVIVFKANTNFGKPFIQTYTLQDGYNLDYDINYEGLDKIFDAKATSIELNWKNYLHPYERNAKFEQQYSAVYYKESEESVDDCGCMQDDKQVLNEKKVDWISHSNQYFNTTIITKSSPFESAIVESVGPALGKDSDADHMELLTSTMSIPLNKGGASNFDMTMYLGPNEYENLNSFDVSLEYIIPFGNSIFGSINRWVIRPVFDFMSRYIGSLGIVIILVIFVIKMLLYPLMYKMLHSQALMGALKPELAHLNDKYKDDAQKKQMETMKIYREYGVSPLGGCLPMVIQMPIWYALFRFFPASFAFRQESFLWAHDLSSFDDFFHLPFFIPFVGDHLSLFTILYSISMLLYTYYNTKHMDMSANPAMKYMQYLMPVMFFGFFNTYASGLTAYMFFSNLMNISQTVITKKFVFKDERLMAELKAKKAKPKKKGGFQQRMEEALKQQQSVAAKKKKK
jgi:YidC/Oxa1 family membrane protein insertase